MRAISCTGAERTGAVGVIKASRPVLVPCRLKPAAKRNLFSARAQGEEADLSGEVRTGYEPACNTLHPWQIGFAGALYL